MKNKLTILLFSILISFSSYGELVKIGKSVTGDTFYIDTDTIKEHWGYVYYWGLGDRLKPTSTEMMSAKIYKQGECEVNQFKTLSYIWYKQPMGEGVGETYNPPNPKWKYPPLDSVDRTVLKYVCDYVNNSYGSFGSFGLFSLFEDTVCIDTNVQKRGGIYYLPNETKPFTGKNLCKYENGQKKYEGKYKDGQEDGKWTFWYENGQIEAELNFIDGKKDGKFTSWYESGHKKREKYYKDDKIDGKDTWWYENGQKRLERNWKDGQEDGKLTVWGENGQIETERNYKDDKCVSGDCD